MNYAVCLLAAVTGARLGSVISLTREDIVRTKHGKIEFYTITLN